MTRGPGIGSNRTTSSINKALKAWGACVPPWISTLAEECDGSSQRRVAEELGVSAALLSNVLGNKYPGDLVRIEQAVSARFMRVEVDCPVLGRTSRCNCLEHQGRGFSTASPLHLRLFRACPNCPNFARKPGR